MKLHEFFADPTIIQSRINVARKRALRAIDRIDSATSSRGTGDTVYVGDKPSLSSCTRNRSYLALTDPFDQLVYMIDYYDGSRARKRVQQNEHPYTGVLVAPPPRVHPPNDVTKRRAAIFSAKDMPTEMIEDMSRTHIFKIVEWVRLELMRIALRNMVREREMFLLNDNVWQVYVSVMDDYRLSERIAQDEKIGRQPQQKRQPSKYDDRHYHGHPKSHRQRVITST